MEEDDFISSHRKAKADTRKRERVKRAVVPKEANTVTGQVLAPEYS